MSRPAGRDAGKQAPPHAGSAGENIHLGLVLLALVGVIVIVALALWLVPGTLGSGTVNITIRN